MTDIDIEALRADCDSADEAYDLDLGIGIVALDTETLRALLDALADARAEVERLRADREDWRARARVEVYVYERLGTLRNERDAARVEVAAFRNWRDEMARDLPGEYREDGAAVEVGIQDCYGDGIAALADLARISEPDPALIEAVADATSWDRHGVQYADDDAMQCMCGWDANGDPDRMSLYRAHIARAALAAVAAHLADQ
jgi:hypothetical protein